MTKQELIKILDKYPDNTEILLLDENGNSVATIVDISDTLSKHPNKELIEQWKTKAKNATKVSKETDILVLTNFEMATS